MPAPPRRLAQAAATLPPLLKQLAQQRDLLGALAGGFPNREPPERFELGCIQHALFHCHRQMHMRMGFKPGMVFGGQNFSRNAS
jgi:hypothetical protein